MDLFPVLVPVGFPGGMDAAIGALGVVAEGVVGANAEGQWTAFWNLWSSCGFVG